MRNDVIGKKSWIFVVGIVLEVLCTCSFSLLSISNFNFTVVYIQSTNSDDVVGITFMPILKKSQLPFLI